MNLDVIKNKLLVKYPFFGSIIANINFIETRDCIDYNGNPTLGTDADNIYIHPDFFNSLSLDEKIFVFAHEVGHIAFDHIYRSEGKDKKLWNIATDAVINAQLKQDGLTLIKGVVDIPEAINYNAEEMYNKLLEQKNQNNQNNNSQQNSSKNSNNEDKEEKQNNDVGHDTHSMWNKSIERKKQQKESEENQGKSNNASDENEEKKNLFDKIFDRKNKKKEQSNEVLEYQNKEENKTEEQIKKFSQLGEKKIYKQNEVERKQQLEELKNSLIKQSMGAGNETNSNQIKFGSVGESKPLIDWRLVLKEAIKLDVDWSYKNATIEEGVVMAHLEDIPQPETEILLDTSNSIDDNLLKNFLRECKNILQSSKVKVGCFDTKFYGFQEIRDVEDIDNITFTGRGGTDFNVAVNAFSNRVENKIIFTDGDAKMPSKVIDAIWIVFGGKKINPKGGKVINISDEDLERLNSNNQSRSK